jgi:UDP-N-acetyl-D-glucosamine dehydrogenase
VNELAILCSRLGVDVWEVIEGAATKPFGFMPFYPGPGLGGHCLPVDPLYLSWKARLLDFEARFIDLASQVNGHMPHYVVDVVSSALNERGKALRGAKILLLGVAYKSDVIDVRESPAFDIIKLLFQQKVKVFYHDPYVPKVQMDGQTLHSHPLHLKSLSRFDCVVIVTNHRVFDYDPIVKGASLVVDTRNATKEVKNHRDKIVKI